MMQDVVDLRHENWVSRKEDNSPKTIDELHKEAADKAKKARLKIQLEKKIQRGIYCTFSNFISCHNGDLGDLPLWFGCHEGLRMSCLISSWKNSWMNESKQCSLAIVTNLNYQQ